MEVEAKYSIVDEATFRCLLETSSLAGFTVEGLAVAELYDRYLDTAEGDLQAGGFACRLRQENTHYVVTLKGLGAVSDAIHHRIEYEVDLPGPLRFEDWPASPARDLALRLSRGEPLLPLLEVSQIRHRRWLRDGRRLVAEVSLDRFRFQQSRFQRERSPQEGTVGDVHLELEIELLADGHEGDLKHLAAELEERWGLTPQPKSKLERGLTEFGAA